MGIRTNVRSSSIASCVRVRTEVPRARPVRVRVCGPRLLTPKPNLSFLLSHVSFASVQIQRESRHTLFSLFTRLILCVAIRIPPHTRVNKLHPGSRAEQAEHTRHACPPPPHRSTVAVHKPHPHPLPPPRAVGRSSPPLTCSARRCTCHARRRRAGLAGRAARGRRGRPGSRGPLPSAWRRSRRRRRR